jgi:pyruvate/2-oxoglutarate dehydrogenase complex dihydrolipoamide dehydrogenase (E3) component
VYRFSGVSDDGLQGDASRKEATSIHCTNVSAANNQVEVQLYQWNGTDVFTGTANIPPNGTLTFSTQNTTIYFDDVLLGGSPGTTAIFQGSGVILAESSQIVCSVQVLDPLTYPPIFAVGLEIYKR